MGETARGAKKKGGGGRQMIDQFIHVGVFDIESSPFN